MANARFRPRGDTAANMTSVNPTLAVRELALELDTGKMKVGDGTTPWTSLAYFGGGGAVSSVQGRTGAVTLISSDVTGALGYTPMRGSNNLSEVTNAATARTNIGVTGGFTAIVADRTALSNLSTAHIGAYLKESGREGVFVWDGSNNAANVTADTAQGLYVAPASDTTGASGAWVRRFGGSVVDAEWFGFVADDATDNYAAWQALYNYAVANRALVTRSGFDFVYKAPFAVRFKTGTYYFSQYLNVHLQWTFFAEHGAGNAITGSGHPTQWRFRADSYGVIFNDTNTDGPTYSAVPPVDYWDAAGTELRNIAVVGGGGTDKTKHGIWCRTKVALTNIAADNFPGTNLRMVGTGSSTDNFGHGNVNASIVNGYTSSNSGKHGLYTAGSDANAIIFSNINILSAGCGGIVEDGFLGNTYSSANVHGCGSSALGGATFGGRHYLYVGSEAAGANGATTTPGTNSAVWLDVEAGTANSAYPAWSNAATYIVSCAFYGQGGSNRSCFYNPYIEGNAYFSHVGSPGIVIAPNSYNSWTKTTPVMYSQVGNGQWLSCPWGFGSWQNSPTATTFGDHFAASVGSEEGVLVKGESQLLPTIRLAYDFNSVHFTWDGSGASATWQYINPSSPLSQNMVFGRSTVQGSVNLFTSFALGPNGFFGRIITADSAAPTTGEHAAGERVFNNGASTSCATVSYWLCTVGGTPGTWIAVSPPTGVNTGDQTITLTGDATGSGTGSFAVTVGKINGVSLAGLATGILKNTTTTGVPSIAVAADFPTLNQNTTGSAATLTTGRTIAMTGDVSWTSPAFDGSGNVTAAGTLATVNGNVGSFGSATAVPVVTVNGKGLVTAVSTTTITTPAPSVQSVTSAATVTPTFSDDMVKITAQAAGLTLANPSGTAVAGHKFIIRIKDNGTAQTIAYGTQYRAIGVTLPTTTVISKNLYLGCIWNADDTKLDVVAVSQE